MALVQITTLLLLAAFQLGFIDATRPDYKFIAGAWYKFYGNAVTWYVARDTCQSEGARLFHPVNEDEFRQVKIGLIDSIPYTHSGFSDLMKPENYETVDGRPLRLAYNKWQKGYPGKGSSNGWHCGELNANSLEVSLLHCDWNYPFICKSAVDPVASAIYDARTTIVNASDNIIAALERQTANQPSLILERIAAAVVNHTNALERLTVNHAAAMQQLTANLTAALDKLMTNMAAGMQQLRATVEIQAVNQTASSDRLMTNMAAAIQQLTAAIGTQASNQGAAMQQLTAAIGQQAANQTAAMERQALALEKLASQEENSQ